MTISKKYKKQSYVIRGSLNFTFGLSLPIISRIAFVRTNK